MYLRSIAKLMNIYTLLDLWVTCQYYFILYIYGIQNSIHTYEL